MENTWHNINQMKDITPKGTVMQNFMLMSQSKIDILKLQGTKYTAFMLAHIS